MIFAPSSFPTTTKDNIHAENIDHTNINPQVQSDTCLLFLKGTANAQTIAGGNNNSAIIFSFLLALPLTIIK